MTAAHRPGAILTPRCRGARAVANFNAAERHGATNQIQRIPVGQLSGRANAAHGFCLAVGSAALFNAPQPQQEAARVGHAAGRQFNAADARSRATHLRSGWSPIVETHPCAGRCSGIGPEMPARRSSARPAEPFNAASNERSPEPGRCLVSSEAPGCRGDAYTQPSPCEMTTHCMAKANVGDGGRHGCTHSDRQRPARFAAVLCRLPRPFSSLVHRPTCLRLPVGIRGNS